MTNSKAFLTRIEQAWRDRAVLPDGRRLTRLHVHIAAKLAYWRTPNPKHRALARAARCCARTVRRALAVLHGLGLLSWTRIVVYCRGWRAQVANAYEFPSFPKPLSFLPIRIKSSANLSPPGTVTPAAPGDAPLLKARREELLRRDQAAAAIRRGAVRLPLGSSAM